MIELTDISVLCLTLPDARERQRLVKQQFVRHRFKQYGFFPGVHAQSEQVREAYASKRVAIYPGCFRCGQGDCGKDCNNILIPQQVAVVLSYQSLFQRIAASNDAFVLVCEDDAVFADYAHGAFGSTDVQAVLAEANKNPATPFLLRLAAPSVPEYFYKHELLPTVKITSEPQMSNCGFIVNKAMAKRAVERFNTINHTADVILHRDLSTVGYCVTLLPQLIHDRSWATGEVSSTIHPKPIAVEHCLKTFGEHSIEYQAAVNALKNHRKKAYETAYAFVGSPRCGSHYLSELLIANGRDIAHEKLGEEGICAWQYAVYSVNHPYITDIKASNSFFLYPKKYYLYVRHPLRAIPSLMTENAQAPLSYAYRRDIIRQKLGINLDLFACEITRAARSYIHWYELALRNPISGIVRVEYAVEDLNAIGDFSQIQDVVVSEKKAGKGKPYLGVEHKNPELPVNWLEQLNDETRLRLLMMARQFGYDV